MTSDSIVNVTGAKATLHKLVNADSFAISRHGKIVGIYLCRDRIEALIETMELLSTREFPKTLKDYESGRMKFYRTADLDKAMALASRQNGQAGHLCHPRKICALPVEPASRRSILGPAKISRNTPPQQFLVVCGQSCYRDMMTTVPKIKSVRLFVKPWCGWCRQAEKWLDAHGVQYERLDVVADPKADEEMRKLSGQGLAPVIDVDGQILADFGAEQLAEFWKRFE